MPRYLLFTNIILVVFLASSFIFLEFPMLYLDLITLYLYSLIGIIFLKRGGEFYIKLLLLIILTALIEYLSYTFSVLFGNNHPIYHVAVPVLIVTYGWIFSGSLFKARNWNFLFMILLLASLSILNSIFIQEVSTAPSYGMILLSLFVITCSLFQFKRILKDVTVNKLLYNPIFWFSASTLFFYTLTFMPFGLHAILQRDLPDFIFDSILWLNLLLYFIYFVAMYLSTKPVHRSK